ncbi:MAG: dUTP diphosphatase [Nitrospinota bacterium]
MILKVKKLHPDALLPEKAYQDDLAYDLFALQENIIKPLETKKISTGIAIEPPVGYGSLIKERSSLALKGIKLSGGVIDGGYRGEIVIIATNFGDKVFTILSKMKIGQLMITKIIDLEIEEIKELDSTVRGSKGFGSTGNYSTSNQF